MTVYIDVDEWYPVYSLSAEHNHDFEIEADVPGELFERWTKNLKEFQELQQEIRKLTIE